MPFPSQLCYEQDYSYVVSPEVVHSSFISSNTRQRQLGNKRDDLHTVTIKTDGTGLNDFERFVLTELDNGANAFVGDYYAGGILRQGSLRIPNGQYSAQYLTEDYWQIDYSFEVRDRSLIAENIIYDAVVLAGGFSNYP